MKNLRFAALAAALAVGACDVPPERPSSGEPLRAAVAQDARAQYAVHCQICHGSAGKGDGPAAEFLFPKPRDFTTATFKLRSTPSGELPTDEDILRTLSRGIPGTSMPAFGHLPADLRRSLAELVKEFAVFEKEGRTVKLFEDRKGSRVVVAAREPGCTPDTLARGRRLYDKMQCAQCHGAAGTGDGPAAPTLVDRWGWPNPPANFANGVFKGGDQTADVYLRFTTGMNGTPMPSYEQNLSDEERWALAYYVKSLVRPGRKPLAYEGDRPLAAAAAADVPLDPNDPAWSKATTEAVPLLSMWQRSETSNYVDVRVLRSPRQLGLLLEWDDSTADGSSLGMREFSDAAAAMFALTDPPGSFTMGEKGRPVNLWQWRFSRQLDLSEFRDVESKYPGMAVDGYFYEKSQETARSRFPGHVPVAGAPSHDPGHLTAWAARNSLSSPSPGSAVEDLQAEGFGTLKPQPASEQNVEGRGIWTAGRWRVVFRRGLSTQGGDADLSGGRSIRIAFAVWDGHAGDRDGKKLITPWRTIAP